MGLLTDPSAEPSKLTKFLVRNNTKINVSLYILGLIYFCLLSHPAINYRTYFSENALLPGLVHSDFREGHDAELYYDELLDEMKKYDNSVPYPWLLAKFRQLGLDTYVHNFTLNYPLKKNQKFTGKNVYAILRAPRAASTESLVLSVPYRPPSSIHLTTAPSIAVMLAFAKFASRGNYWSKDLIFLITEHEQLGVQAWVEAYHGITCGTEGVLNHGDIRGRAGAIQAAINLELHDTVIKKIDIKIFGLNGQLPNLDLFNLASKLCAKEKILNTFRGRFNKYNFERAPFKNWKYAFQTLLSMILGQTTGVPDGNHGLFHRFGIQALTLEGFSSEYGGKADFHVLGELVEHIFRSLNNLLEKLHQSYFFYLLSDTSRFVSIGIYTPVICLMAGTLLLKASGFWFQRSIEAHTKHTKKIDIIKKYKNKEIIEEILKNEDVDMEKIDVAGVLKVIITAHIFGIIILYSPNYTINLASHLGYNYSTEAIIYSSFLIISLLLLFFPIYKINMRRDGSSMKALNMLVSLELGGIIICLSLMNFSYAFILTLFYVPFALFIHTTHNRFYAILQKVFWLLLHPLVFITTAVTIYGIMMFPGESIEETFNRGIKGTQQAVVFSIIDFMVYGNWFYGVISIIFFPIWLSFWYLTFASPAPPNTEITEEKKNV